MGGSKKSIITLWNLFGASRAEQKYIIGGRVNPNTHEGKNILRRVKVFPINENNEYQVTDTSYLLVENSHS